MSASLPAKKLLYVAAIALAGCHPGSEILCPAHMRLIEEVDEIERLSKEIGRPMKESWLYERELSRRYIAKACQL